MSEPEHDRDEPTPRVAGEAGPPEEGGESPERRRRFPAVILAAPGLVCLLFATSTAELADTLGNVGMALTISTAAGFASAGCFGTIAALSETKEGQVLAMIGVGLAVAGWGRGLLMVM